MIVVEGVALRRLLLLLGQRHDRGEDVIVDQR